VVDVLVAGMEVLVAVEVAGVVDVLEVVEVAGVVVEVAKELVEEER